MMFGNYLERLWTKLQTMEPSEVIAGYDEYLDAPSVSYEHFCESELDCAQTNIDAQERRLEKGAQQYNRELEEQEFIDRICEFNLQSHDHDLIIDVVNSRNQDEINQLIDVIDQVVELNGSLSNKFSAGKSDLFKV